MLGLAVRSASHVKRSHMFGLTEAGREVTPGHGCRASPDTAPFPQFAAGLPAFGTHGKRLEADPDWE
jgi:hypothetical protein